MVVGRTATGLESCGGAHDDAPKFSFPWRPVLFGFNTKHVSTFLTEFLKASFLVALTWISVEDDDDDDDEDELSSPSSCSLFFDISCGSLSSSLTVAASDLICIFSSSLSSVSNPFSFLPSVELVEPNLVGSSF